MRIKMKIKLLQKIAIFSAILVLVGCASQTPSVSKQSPLPSCAFQDGPGPYDIPAPEWMCNKNFPGYDLVAVSSYQQSNMGYDYMVTMATSRARNELAREISNTAASSIKDYRSTTGSISAENETTMSVGEITQKILSEVKLTGSRVLNQARNPRTGAIHVAVGLSSDKLDSILDQTVQAAFGSDAAEFQRFKASQSFDSLKADLKGE
jgi:hypothetical protein